MKLHDLLADVFWMDGVVVIVGASLWGGVRLDGLFQVCGRHGDMLE